MTLSAASALFSWDSRHGEVPMVGGDPVHVRASSAIIEDERGQLYPAIINTPRRGWDTIAGVRRQTLLLEGAATNRILYSENFAQWTLGSVGVTRTAGFRDPFGTTGAYQFSSTTVGDNLFRLVPFTNTGRKTVSFFAKQGSSATVLCGLYDATAGTFAQRIVVTWAGGVPTLTTDAGSGALYTPIEHVNGWWRIAFTPAGNVTFTNTNYLYFYVSPTTAGQTTQLFGVQPEDGVFPTSYIATAGVATTRAADLFYFDGSAPTLQAMGLYVRFADWGTFTSTSLSRIVMLEEALGTNPKFGLYVSAAGTYTAYFHNGTSPVLASLTPGVATGDVVELVALLTATGTVRILASLNGASASDSGASGTLAVPGTWAVTRVGVHASGNTVPGFARFADIRIVRYGDIITDTADHIMQQLREFEVMPGGDLL